MEEINWQLSSVFVLFLAGILWGFIYNIMRILSWRRKKKGLYDMLFWMISFVVIVPLIYLANWMELRVYVWISLGTGIVAYRVLFFRPVTAVLKKITGLYR